jgi:type IV secretory pathway VirB4 component
MPKEPTTSTQELVAVKEIRDGVLYLKNGGVRRILIVSGVNFDLKSEAEQGLILGSFQNFLNTLDFSVQFFIHSRKVNVDAYLASMRARMEEETSELLKIQIEEYVEFIRTFVEENAIISKTFFVVVPYEPLVPTEGKFGVIVSFFKGTNRGGTTPAEATNVQEILSQLERRVSQVIEGLSQIGLRASPLENDAAIELFYNLYNPELTEKKKAGRERA